MFFFNCAINSNLKQHNPFFKINTNTVKVFKNNHVGAAISCSYRYVEELKEISNYDSSLNKF